jgi:3-oxoacyl-[acyl-carrier protein] reductase
MIKKTMRLRDKVAIVTGAGRGIGRAEALLLARQGAKVVVNDLGGGPTGGGGDRAVADAVVEEINRSGGEAVAEASSISSMAGGKALVEAALSAFGRIDILINNAGIARPGRIDTLTEEDWDLVHNVNLKGYFAAIRHVAPHFVKQKSGIVVNTSSASGFGHYGMGNYNSAKEGVVGLTRSVARDLGQFGVRCNAIRPISGLSQMGTPAVMDTIRVSVEELGVPPIWNRSTSSVVAPMPEHVAALAVWLCTEATREVNGREFFISGSEVGILPEPELMRAIFNAKGWDIDRFDEPGTRTYLIGDMRNRYSLKS